MAKTKVSEWDSTPGNNTDIDSINIAEGCAPSGINNAIRELMSQVKDFQQGTYSDPFNGPVNGTVGATTPAAGAFTTLTASSTATLNTLASSGATLTGGSINNMAIGGSTASTGAFTTLAASGAVTLSGGTANGVAYLNGSKVLTTGSALTFNGTNLSVTGSLTSSNAGNENVFLSDGSVVSSLQNGANSLYFNVNTNSATSGNFIWRNTSSYSEQMRLTSTGLGIGTSSPSAPLTVQGSAGGLGINIIGRSAGQNEAWLYWYKNGGSTLNAGILGDNQGLKFAVDSSATERMRLDSSGNLGLAVTPSAWGSNYKAIQLGAQTALYNAVGYVTSLNTNAFENSSGELRRIAAGEATRYVQAGGAHQWFSAANGSAGAVASFTQAMTLDASGNLGVGTTSPTAVGGYVSVSANGSTGSLFDSYANGTLTGRVQASSNAYFITAQGASTTLAFGTVNTERARIDSSGNLLVGTTTAGAGWGAGGKLTVDMGSSYAVLKGTGAASAPALLCWNAVGTGDDLFITFATETGGTTRGSIDYNRAGGLTRYNTTSDYRAKTVNGPVQNALAKVAALKPSTGRMNEATEDIDFFVAHELQEVVPSAVSGQKDAINEDGTPKYQMVDKSALIPLLTAAIQEQQAIINAQAAALNQLKARLDAANL